MQNSQHPSTFNLTTAQQKQLQKDLISYLTGKGWTVKLRPSAFEEDWGSQFPLNWEVMEIINPHGIVISRTTSTYLADLMYAASDDLIADKGIDFDPHFHLSFRGYKFKTDSAGLSCICDPTDTIISRSKTVYWQVRTVVGELLAWERFVDDSAFK